MQRLITLLALVILTVAPAHAGYVTTTNGIAAHSTAINTITLASAAATVAGMTYHVTTHEVLTTAVAWPADRAIVFDRGGYVTFTGSGALTGLLESQPEFFGVNTTPGTTDMTTPITRAFAAATRVKATGTYKTTSPIPITANQKIYGGGAFANYTTDILKADSVSGWSVTGMNFTGKASKVAIRAADTTAPCSNLTVTGNTCTNIKLFNSFSSLHEDTDPTHYYYNYYDSTAHQASNLTITNNTGTCASPADGTTEMFIFVQFATGVMAYGNTAVGYRDGISLWGGDWNKDHWTTANRAAGNAVLGPNILSTTQSGVSVICAHDWDVPVGNVTALAAEVLDSEGSSGGIFHDGKVATNSGSIFNLFNSNEDVTFANVIGSCSTGGSALFNNTATLIASQGKIKFDNVTVTSSDPNALFSVGSLNHIEVRNSTFQNVVYSQFGPVNTQIIENNTFSFTGRPLVSGSLHYMMSVGFGATGWTLQALTPVTVIKGNKFINKTTGSFTDATWGIQLRESNTTAARTEITNNRIEASRALYFANNSGTARTVSVHDNVFGVSASVLDWSNGNLTGDSLYWRNNQDASGADVYGALASIDAIGIWKQGSRVDNNSAAAGVTPGWVVDGSNTWKPLPNL